MKRFILKLALFSVFPFASLLGVFLLENGTTDPFYQRFTTPKQNSLVLGTSKAAQGIVPSVINEELNGVFEGKIYNYSFTVNSSPFGPVYLESIKRKLTDESRPGYFIVTVDPWSISSDVRAPNDLRFFEESGNFLDQNKFVDLRPNLWYLMFNYDRCFYEILLLKFTSYTSKLHNDGWFQAGKLTTESTRTEKRKLKVNQYSKMLEKYTFSNERLDYLMQTITFLKQRGKVYVIRMPIHADILQIEDELDGDFNKRMVMLSKRLNILYFDFNKKRADYIFKDGIHLVDESAKAFSEVLAQSIKESF